MAYKQENQQSTETNREIIELMELADRHIKGSNWFLQKLYGHFTTEYAESPVTIRKAAQYLWLSGKCKLKPLN